MYISHRPLQFYNLQAFSLHLAKVIYIIDLHKEHLF